MAAGAAGGSRAHRGADAKLRVEPGGLRALAQAPPRLRRRLATPGLGLPFPNEGRVKPPPTAPRCRGARCGMPRGGSGKLPARRAAPDDRGTRGATMPAAEPRGGLRRWQCGSGLLPEEMREVLSAVAPAATRCTGTGQPRAAMPRERTRRRRRGPRRSGLEAAAESAHGGDREMAPRGGVPSPWLPARQRPVSVNAEFGNLKARASTPRTTVFPHCKPP